MTARRIVLNGAAVRVTYGLLSLFAPRLLFKFSGKPVDAEPRYFNALFGGRDLSIAAVTVSAANAGRERDALLLNMSCEATDLAALVQELRQRRGLDRTMATAVAINVGAWVTWLSAWRKLHG